MNNTMFRPYMSKHYRSWHEFALSKGLALEETDLVLISSFVKTSQWAIAAFSHPKRSHQISFNASLSPFVAAEFGISFGEETGGFIPQRRGPILRPATGPNDSEASSQLRPDQSLFICYYKLRKRRLARRLEIGISVEARDAIGSPEDDYQGSLGRSRASSSSGGLLSRSISDGTKSSHTTSSDEMLSAPSTSATSVSEDADNVSLSASDITELPSSEPVGLLCSQREL
jgi:hypothetical protein